MVELRKGQFFIDEKPFYIYSGEIHYFRVAPRLWPKHLQRAKEAGLNTVGSYIPWAWHEPEEGKFDFTGRTHPERNLLGYLKMVKEHGLKFLARIGPVSNAELINEGIPDWLLKNHPEVFGRGRGITNLPHVTLLSYLNDTFQRYVEKWYRQVLPIVKNHQWPQGSIILVQLDNEVGMVHWLNKAADYSAQTEELYRHFLRRRYGEIKKLNRIYRTGYRDFSEVNQPASGSDAQNKNLLWDWMNFYQHYYASYYASLYRRYRKKMINLPVLANLPQFYDFDVRGRGVYSPMTAMMFRDFPEFVPAVIFGGAYQMRRLDYENFHDVAIATELLKMMASPGIPSFCAELQTGIMRDRPRLYVADVELNLKASAAHGLNGINCYMFSGGKNKMEFAALGTYHEWQAPVTSGGQKRNHFSAVEDFGRLVKSFGSQMSNTVKQFDTAIGFYPPCYTTGHLSGRHIESWEWKKQHLFYDGLVRLLQLANLNYIFIDLQKVSLKHLQRQPSLWVFTLGFMDEETQRKLVEYVRGGGRLILNPYLPDKNLALRKCPILADYLKVKTERRTSGQPLNFFIGSKDYLAQGEISIFSGPPDAKIVATSSHGQPCGLLIPRDAGKVLLLGFGLNHMFDYHIDLVGHFARMAGVKPSIKVDKGLQVALRKNEDYGFLFLANYHDEPKETKIKMVLPGERRVTTFPAVNKIKISNRQSYILPLNVPLPSGDKIRYSTAEILDRKEVGIRKTLSLRGAAGSAAEIEIITSCRHVALDSKRVRGTGKPGKLRANFTLNGRIQQLVIK